MDKDKDIDATLAMVVGLVEAAPEPSRVVADVTVLTGGREITGHVITEVQYYHGLARNVAQTDDHDMLGRTFRELARVANERILENRQRMATRFQTPPPPPPDGPEYIHLESTAREAGTSVWRVRLQSVDAWSLGDLRVELPKI